MILVETYSNLVRFSYWKLTSTNRIANTKKTNRIANTKKTNRIANTKRQIE